MVDSWKTVERPGYLGTSRNQVHDSWNERFGEGRWKIAWQWGNYVIERPMALQIYEDGYYHFLKANPQILDWLVNSASDVYDTDISNVQAGLSYDVQETQNNHIHDVAIRRSVLRLGRFFAGDHLMHVRPEQEGERLGPQLIPFHLPEMIYRGDTLYKGKPRDFTVSPPWWIEMGIRDSVEEFYQNNKVLQVK